MIKRRKLALKTETIRNLTPQELGNVVGGLGTVGMRCSTMADSNCCQGGTVWGCGQDPTFQTCATANNYC